jgi:hypothetical protein
MRPSAIESTYPILIRNRRTGEALGISLVFNRTKKIPEETRACASRPLDPDYSTQIITLPEFETYKALGFNMWINTKVIWFKTPSSMIYAPVFKAPNGSETYGTL